MNPSTAGTPENLDAMRRSLEFQTKMNYVMQAIHGGGSFAEIMPQVEKEILGLINAERVTIFQRNRSEKQLVSKHHSAHDVEEIRVPLTASSIVGYVAMSQSPVRIDDVYDEAALKSIHPNLRFGGRDLDKQTGYRTHTIIAVPIKAHDVLLGVLQLINHQGGGSFSDKDLECAIELSKILGQRFLYDFQATRDPYDYLVQTRKISAPYLEEMKARARKEKVPITRLLLSEGAVRRKQLGASLERYFQVPFMSYEPTIRVPPLLLKGISRSYLRNQCWVPVSLDEDEVVVLMANPMDAQRVMDIDRTLMVRNYVFRVGIEDDIHHFIDEIDKPIEPVQSGEMVGILREEGEEGEEEEEGEESTDSIIQTVKQIILDAQQARASDIHIEPGRGGAPATVRIRVDGLCQPLTTLPAADVQAVISRIKIISTLDIAERRKPQDGKCRLQHGDLDLELRVATIPTVNGEAVVLRLLPAREPVPMKQLSLSERNLMEIVRLVNRPHGFFLVVGPTGSGKTTTLHAILGYLNRPERKIWTAEDPVEITQAGLQQVQVRPDHGLTFGDALRAFLRADPDVIMVGEMRDRETAAMAVDASLTGHLVFATLHTNSAPETVVRLLDLGVDPVSFADAPPGSSGPAPGPHPVPRSASRPLCSTRRPTTWPGSTTVRSTSPSSSYDRGSRSSSGLWAARRVRRRAIVRAWASTNCW